MALNRRFLKRINRRFRRHTSRRRSWSWMDHDQVRRLRRMYASGQFSQRQIAAMFGVAQPTVSAIARGKLYKEAGGPRTKVYKQHCIC